jgi:putative proteasome-type protease
MPGLTNGSACPDSREYRFSSADIPRDQSHRGHICGRAKGTWRPIHPPSGIGALCGGQCYTGRNWGVAQSMTYCGGILVREGLVMFADTRTNAGVDNISTFRKLHVFKDPKKRVMAIASAGNLSISQSVVSTLTEGYDNPETGERETLMNAPTLFQAARRVGHVVRTIHQTEAPALESSDVSFDVSFLFGGQIMGERMRLFMIYSAGNFIECTVDTPYLQIGEHKYGKPVLDRAINYEMDIYDALKVGLVSIDSTMRSNLSVGMPIDLMVLRRDTCDPELIYRIEPGEPYFTDLRERWSAALRAAHIGIPRPPYANRR